MAYTQNVEFLLGFISGRNITTQHSNFTIGTTHTGTGTDSFNTITTMSA
jgi:hypothetical protein